MSKHLTITAPEGFTNPRLGYVEDGSYWICPITGVANGPGDCYGPGWYRVLVDKIEPRTWKLTECEFEEATENNASSHGFRLSISKDGNIQYYSKAFFPVGTTWLRLSPTN